MVTVMGKEEGKEVTLHGPVAPRAWWLETEALRGKSRAVPDGSPGGALRAIRRERAEILRRLDARPLDRDGETS